MNYKAVFSFLGKTLIIEAILLVFPLLVGIIYQENNFLAFLVPIILLLAVGFSLSSVKPKEKTLYAKEGFVIVALSWILLSLFGCLPFVISKSIPNFLNAFFETVSGFSTTGATILTATEIESLDKALTFWRIFTHWIGGMGILVFSLAIMPSNNAGIIHVFKNESTGPSASKITNKLKFTARILYGIYVALTLIEFVLLLCGGLNAFDSLLLSFSTAGTGGFGVLGDSAISYTSYIQIILTIFMFLFSLNFNVFYLILIGSVTKIFAIEEVKAFIIVLLSSTIVIALNIFFATDGIYKNFGEALKHAVFQVASISSTTGLVSTNYDLWPTLSKVILMALSIIGACGGSTGGGIKVSRALILLKSTSADFKKLLHPNAVIHSKLDGKAVEHSVVHVTRTFFITWVLTVIVSTLLLSFDSTDIFTNFSASIACIGNVGPGFGVIGAVGDYTVFSQFSKVVLSIVMLIGRLEIFPILILFAPRTWQK